MSNTSAEATSVPVIAGISTRSSDAMASEVDVTQIYAMGPGLLRGETGVASHFTVYSNQFVKGKFEFSGALDFRMEGPSEPIPLDCSTNEEDGSIGVTYSPILPGKYTITIMANGQHIRGSPFVVTISGESIRQNVLTSKVDVYGSVLKGAKVRQENEVMVNIHEKAISGGLKVRIAGPPKAKSSLKLMNLGNALYKVTFNPSMAGTYFLHVTIADVHVPKSPFEIKVQ